MSRVLGFGILAFIVICVAASYVKHPDPLSVPVQRPAQKLNGLKGLAAAGAADPPAQLKQVDPVTDFFGRIAGAIGALIAFAAVIVFIIVLFQALINPLG
jgi:hypothetical protein